MKFQPLAPARALWRFLLSLPSWPRNLWLFWHDWIWRTFTFAVLLLVYVLYRTAYVVCRLPLTIMQGRGGDPSLRMSKFLCRFNGVFHPAHNETIDRISLIELAFQNMAFKRTRSIITIGGMALGIGTIVFLVSLGYGVNKLVIDQVARLEEMMQTDITPQPGSSVQLTDASMAAFNDLPHVKQSFPVIAVVAKITYQSSITDVAVYGVTSDYLTQSAIKPSQGQIFSSNDIARSMNEPLAEVAGVSTLTDTKAQTPQSMGQEISQVDYSISPETWVRVRQEPSANSPLLGYTKRVSNSEVGTNVWGKGYEEGSEWGEWVQTEVPLWEATTCDPTTDLTCVDGRYRPLVDDSGNQRYAIGYLAHLSLRVSSLGTLGPEETPTDAESGNVLGLTTSAGEESTVENSASSASSASESALIANVSADGEWVELASESGTLAQTEKKVVALPEKALKKAVVNQAMLNILGISANEAIGKTFEASFVVVGDLLGEDKEQIESVPAPYEIVGVVPDEKVPYFYVPFVDLRSLGITQFSQAKVVVADKRDLQQTRQQIEAMGFSTRPVVDTIAQIDQLFSTARTVLALLGMVALAVASLGMFNTLTVSLLERTKEVGLMKAMGMRSDEVRELFLTESMVMGFMGGLMGIFLGWLAGKGLGLFLSVFSIVQGQGLINVSYIPFAFIAAIFVLSLIVGLITGVYPARRATRISALNALRYE